MPVTVNPNKFSFEILPAFAEYLLQNHLADYVKKNLQFAVEEDLPLLKTLSKFSAEELTAIGTESTREILTALSNQTIHLHIENNVKKWISNSLEVIDRFQVVAEDVTLLAYIRRKILTSFVPDFTTDAEIKDKLLAEIDAYTTREELISYTVYLEMQQEKLNKVNEQLAFQESLLLEAQEISELGSFFIDYINPENSIATPQMAKISGLPLTTTTEEFFSHIHPEDSDRARSVWEKAFSDGGSFNYFFRYLLDGKQKFLHSRGIITVKDKQILNLRGTLRDVTKEHRLIAKLTESEALHKQAQKLTKLGNWNWDINTNAIEWSDEMYRIYGLEPQSEPITFERFLSLIHPEDRERRLAEIQESLQTCQSGDYVLKILNPDGQVKVLKGRGSIECDKDGKPIRLLGTCQDITKEFYLNQELIKLNESLSLKNEELLNINKELESFNYIASHDLQEPLRKIRIFTDRLHESNENLSEQSREYLQKVISSATRMQQLIADLIEFSQISSPSASFEEVDLYELTSDVMASFSETSENVQPVFNVGDLPKIEVIPFQFSQLLTNIIGNALKYRDANKTPEISVSFRPAEKLEHSEDPKNKYFGITICDNGIGFEADQNEKIFDLFKRLHSSDKFSGTGIGLAICKKIVQNHNGIITANSTKGKGSCFTIYLPESRLIRN